MSDMKFYINSGFETTHYSIKSKKIRRDIRLAVLADLHNCMLEDMGRRLFHEVDKEAPDLVIKAGDMVDSIKGSDPTRVMKVVGMIHEHYPVIYGMGNHEKKILQGGFLHRERAQLIRGLNDARLKILSDSYKYIEDTGIKVSCLDLDLSYFCRGLFKPLSVRQIEEKIGELERDKFNILIAHDPQYFVPYSDYGSDLVLSGHMHGGIVRLPYLGGVVSPKLRLFPEYDAGSFERKASRMLVTKGLGCHTIQLRINDPTELMIVDLKKE